MELALEMDPFDWRWPDHMDEPWKRAGEPSMNASSQVPNTAFSWLKLIVGSGLVLLGSVYAPVVPQFSPRIQTHGGTCDSRHCFTYAPWLAIRSAVLPVGTPAHGSFGRLGSCSD